MRLRLQHIVRRICDARLIQYFDGVVMMGCGVGGWVVGWRVDDRVNTGVDYLWEKFCRKPTSHYNALESQPYYLWNLAGRKYINAKTTTKLFIARTINVIKPLQNTFSLRHRRVCCECVCVYKGHVAHRLDVFISKSHTFEISRQMMHSARNTIIYVYTLYPNNII